jgi:hypothetical protein
MLGPGIDFVDVVRPQAGAASRPGPGGSGSSEDVEPRDDAARWRSRV